MDFREFVKMFEAGGIYGGPSVWTQTPGTARVGAKDLLLHQFGTTGSPTPATSGAAPSFAGAGAGLGGMQPTAAPNSQQKRMKKK